MSHLKLKGSAKIVPLNFSVVPSQRSGVKKENQSRHSSTLWPTIACGNVHFMRLATAAGRDELSFLAAPGVVPP
jgi:hypothetical protein